MAKAKTIFVCSSCGYESPKWLGKCPACNEWNTFYEEKEQKVVGTDGKQKTAAKPTLLKNVEGKEALRVHTGYQELDRVLGGGLVKGSLVLVGGEPGIGKSTLILQLCNKIASLGEDSKVLYVSGEESAEQVKLRADRLGINSDNIMFLGETDIDAVDSEITSMNPKLVVIDSIQTMYSSEITSAPGTVSQVREITARIMRVCKQNQITTIIIGHVTKDGNIAGPRVLEHMVDTVLYIEGERYFSYRIVRSVKNRFGSTNEIGMFEMQNEGMIEVTNPSSILISEGSDKYSGSVIICTIEGTRPLLVEVQALTTMSVYGIPKRTANVVSGMRINEPAADLGIALVVASSFKNISIPKDIAVIGEVGLTGEIRSVNLIDKRLKEVERLGFTKCLIPENNKKLLKDKYKLDIIGVRNINDALRAVEIK